MRTLKNVVVALFATILAIAGIGLSAVPAHAATHPAPHAVASTPAPASATIKYNSAHSTPDGGRGTYGFAVMGDSYSTGVGGGGASGRCRKGPHGYANHFRTLSNLSCWGNTSQQALHDQVHRLPKGLTTISLTIGGNNIGFVPAMTSCYGGDNRVCTAKLAAAQRNLALGQTRTGVIALLKEIHAEQPHAHVLLLGYPILFNGRNCHSTHFSSWAFGQFNRDTGILDTQLAQAARAVPGVRFVDMRRAFAGHAACSAQEWINSPVGDPTGWFHPNAAGYTHMAATIKGLVRYY